MDGEIFVADSYSNLVKQMREIVYSQPQTNKEHRKDTRRRFYNWDRTLIDDSNDKAFILDLIKCGYLRVLSCNRKPLKTL